MNEKSQIFSDTGNYIEHEKKNPSPKISYKADVFCLTTSINNYFYCFIFYIYLSFGILVV